VSVVLVGGSLKITVPKEVCQHLGLRKGDSVSLWVDNHHIIVEKAASRPGKPEAGG
jgi:antitoxin component of MazEF toxin-antitoxin module